MRNEKLAARMLLLCGVLSFVSSAGAAADAAPDTLPIRGEAMLNALRTTPLPPLPQQLSVSPDGKWILSLEALYRPPYGVGYVNHLSKDVEWALWMYEMASGRRYRVALESKVIESFGPSLDARWSDDGRVALLVHDTKKLSVTVIDARRAGAVTSQALPSVPPSGSIDESVIDWAWDAAANEVLIGLEP